jgi:hypothetical protein
MTDKTNQCGGVTSIKDLTPSSVPLGMQTHACPHHQELDSLTKGLASRLILSGSQAVYLQHATLLVFETQHGGLSTTCNITSF